ncbi:MAG: electron transport complex subunit RsxA [Planctomycetota bacterium]|nr:electron transport complex subunit RsxA [Planctomycetota bacterium]
MVFIIIIISAVLVNNYVLVRFLGLCPFIGVSRRMDTSVGMGMAVIFVMTLASVVTWIIQLLVLSPTEYNLLYQVAHLFWKDAKPSDFNLYPLLRTLLFILAIAALVQFIEMFIKKNSKALYDALGIYLPLITTNCAVLGVTVLNSQVFWANAGEGAPLNLSFLKATVQGFAGGVGFMLAMLLMSGIRERLEMAPIPKALKGAPMAFICTALMALAFGGFAGLVSE